jgi:uncharacterized protein (DUF2225 family)
MEWDGFVRTSYPPMYMHKCPKCGHCEFLSSVEDDIEMTKEEKEQVLGHEVLTFEQMKEMQQMQLQHDYEALRNQAAIAAMQAQVSSFETMEKFVSILKERGDEKAEALEILVAMRSVAYADALIAELRKEKP